MADKFFNINNYRTDVSKEENGVWAPITAAGVDGPTVKVARWGNREFLKIQRELSVKYADQLNSTDEEKVNEVTRKMYVELVAYAVLKDVKGLSLDGEKEWEYTPEEAFDLLLDEGFHDLLEMIETRSKDQNLFRPERKPTPEAEKEAAKTVKKASSSTKK